MSKNNKLEGSNISGIFGKKKESISGIFGENGHPVTTKSISTDAGALTPFNAGEGGITTIPSPYAHEIKQLSKSDGLFTVGDSAKPMNLASISSANKLVPSKYEQQLILACKGYGIYDNLIDQLKSIVSLYTKTRMKYINLADVYFWMFDTCKKYLGSDKLLSVFENKLFKNSCVTGIDEVISLLASELLSMKCIDEHGTELIELVPDDSILKYIHEDYE